VSREVIADEYGPRLWLRGPARWGRHGAGSRTSNLETPSAVPSASTYCAGAVSAQLGNRAVDLQAQKLVLHSEQKQ
jgi:hypothetical protein